MQELRKLQLIQMENMREIQRICDKHNLKCFLMYGSLLGAIRHDGFIPWDDDLDLAMPEEDYKLFIKYAKEELDERFFLHSIESDSNYFPAFIRVRRNDTTFVPNVYKDVKFVNNGVWVDILPLHYAASDHSLTEKVKFFLLRKFFRPMAAINVLGTRKNKLISRVANIVAKSMKLSTIQKWNDIVACACKKERAKFLVCEGNSYNMSRYYYPVEYFGEGKMHAFEGIQCRIPDQADLLLRQIYGDYMQLPPVEEQVGHLPTICDLSKVEVAEIGE